MSAPSICDEGSVCGDGSKVCAEEEFPVASLRYFSIISSPESKVRGIHNFHQLVPCANKKNAEKGGVNLGNSTITYTSFIIY